MRKIKTFGMLLLATVMVLASCKKTDDIETTLYGDAAITAFTLGTLNRYVTTTAEDGTKSTVKSQIDGSTYTFHIDHVNRQVYNTDSLPVGTDVAHVICTVSTRNNGVAVIEDIDSENLYYHSSSDSIDFTQDRKFRVYASDGSGYTQYTIKVNVHTQDGNSFEWTLMDNTWTAPAVNLPTDISQLLGSSTTENYALSNDGKIMVLHQNATEWEEDLFDTDDEQMLPTNDLALTSYPMNLADKTDYVLLVGRRLMDESDDDGNPIQVWRTMTWRKIVDYSEYAPQGHWVYMDRTDNYRFALPATENLSLLKYDDGVLAFGKPYTTIYQSRDNGITWKENSTYKMPKEFDSNATSVTAIVDADNYIWLYCEGTGQVWRGRLNRLGWEYQ